MKKLFLSFAFVVVSTTLSFAIFFLPPPLPTGNVPTLVFQTILSSTTGGGGVKSGVTYSSTPIGTAATNRTILMAAALRENGIETIASVVLNGTISAANVGRRCNSAAFVSCMDIWVASVPTGTTANIVVTYTNPVDSADGLSVWAAYGLNSNTPAATASSISTTAPSLNLNVLSGGLVIAATWTLGVAPPICSWTGLVSNGEILGDPLGGGEYFTSASASNLIAASPRTVSCTYNGTSTPEPVAFAAAFR